MPDECIDFFMTDQRILHYTRMLPFSWRCKIEYLTDVARSISMGDEDQLPTTIVKVLKYICGEAEIVPHPQRQKRSMWTALGSQGTTELEPLLEFTFDDVQKVVKEQNDCIDKREAAEVK